MLSPTKSILSVCVFCIVNNSAKISANFVMVLLVYVVNQSCEQYESNYTAHDYYGSGASAHFVLRFVRVLLHIRIPVAGRCSAWL